MDQTINCPTCKNKMQTKKLPDVTVEECLHCGGLFLDKNELNALAVRQQEDFEICTVEQSMHRDYHGIRFCPKCPNELMPKVTLLNYSSVLFEHCPKCEGLFLDASELATFNNTLMVDIPDNAVNKYRTRHYDHVVTVEKISTTRIGSDPQAAKADQELAEIHFRIVVFFTKSLDAGLKVFRSKNAAKLTGSLGIKAVQDIEIGNAKFDKYFIVQGADTERVKAILGDYVQKALILFQAEQTKVYTRVGNLEVLDNCLVYTEGPYAETMHMDLKKACSNIIDKLVNLTVTIEAYGNR